MPEAAVELGRVVRERQHEPRSLEALLGVRAKRDAAVRELPCVRRRAVRQRRLPDPAAAHQRQAVGTHGADDVVEHVRATLAPRAKRRPARYLRAG